MSTDTNNLNALLTREATGIGLWCALANPYSTEAVAGSGADWLLIDGEHSRTTCDRW